MNAGERELRDTVAAVMKAYPLWGTKWIIRETAKLLIARPGWTAGDVPSTRHAWPAYLSYSGQLGGCSWDRYFLGLVIAEVQDGLASKP